MDYPGFVAGSYPAQAVTLDQERTVNWYVERTDPGAKGTARAALYPTPGVTSLATGGNGSGRGHFSADQREFCVIGNRFYEVDSIGIMTDRGGVATSPDPVTISSNGDGGGQLFITSGGNGYIFTLATNTLTQVAALNGLADMGDHLDGYFLALYRAGSTMYASELLDGLTWNTGTQFAQRSAAPDPWISMKVLGRYIWLLGEQTSEVWYDAGGVFPFELHPSGLISYGTAASFSPAVGDGALYWLGASKIGDSYVMRTTGFAPEVISHPPMEMVMGAYPQVSDAFGECYSDDGHTHYVLSFPRQKATWAYSTKSASWAERGTWLQEIGAYTYWRPRHHAFAFGEHRILDADGPQLYRMGRELGLDVDERLIRRLRRAPALMQENQRIYYSAFELDLEPGLGQPVGPDTSTNDAPLVTAPGYDPQVGLRYSNDGGKTWGPEIFRGAGKIGEYGKRVRWNRMGQGRRRVYEVCVSDPIPWKVTNAYLQIGQPVAGGRP